MNASDDKRPGHNRSIVSRRKEILTGSVMLAGMAGTFLSIEAFMRFQEIVQFGKNQAVVETSSLFYVDSATGLRRLKPGAKSGHIAVNAYGFRGPEIAPQSEGSIVQIAFLGHSTTFDPYVDEKHNWPYLVSKAIAADLPSCTVQFMNGGVPGYGTAAMVRYFDAYVKPHKPVLTFLLTADYDGNMNAEAREQHVALFHPKQNWLAENSRLIGKLDKNAAVLSLMRSATSEVNKLKPDWADLDARFSRSLSTAVEQLRASGTNIALITTAHRLRPEQSAAEQVAAAKSQLEFAPYASVPTLVEIGRRYNHIVADASRRYGTMLVDDVDAIPGTAGNYVDSDHFSAAGSRLMAQRVMAELHRRAQYKQLIQNLDQQCGAQPHA